MTRDELIFALRALKPGQTLTLTPATRYEVTRQPVFADEPEGTHQFIITHYEHRTRTLHEPRETILDVLRLFGVAAPRETGSMIDTLTATVTEGETP